MYDWKLLPELAWAAVVGAAVVVGEALIAFDPATITDWQTWALGLMAGAARAAVAAALARLSTRAATA